MQPLKATVSPSAGSTIGWPPIAERSMIESLRCPIATGPRAQTPEPSGPRCSRHRVIRSRVATSALRPSVRSSPASPHIRLLLLGPGHDPGVLGAAAARAVDHEAAGG